MASSEDSSMIPPPPADTPSPPGEPRAANPAALTTAQLARMLGVPEETVRGHLAAGAPAGADGPMNLAPYAVWSTSNSL